MSNTVAIINHLLKTPSILGGEQGLEGLSGIEGDFLLACMEGDYCWVQKCLPQIKNVNQFYFGYTPLHIACSMGSASLVNLLVEAGANVNAISEQEGVTPLHLVGQAPDPVRVNDIVRELLRRGADIEAKSKSGATPLLDAVVAKSVKTITELLMSGANPTVTINSELGQAGIFHLAAFVPDNVKVIAYLMDILPGFDDGNDFLVTPLMIAIRKGNITNAIYFLNRGADPYRVAKGFTLRAFELGDRRYTKLQEFYLQLHEIETGRRGNVAKKMEIKKKSSPRQSPRKNPQGTKASPRSPSAKRK